MSRIILQTRFHYIENKHTYDNYADRNKCHVANVHFVAHSTRFPLSVSMANIHHDCVKTPNIILITRRTSRLVVWLYMQKKRPRQKIDLAKPRAEPRGETQGHSQFAEDLPTCDWRQSQHVQKISQKSIKWDNVAIRTLNCKTSLWCVADMTILQRGRGMGQVHIKILRFSLFQIQR